MTLSVKATKCGQAVVKQVSRELANGGKITINSLHARPGVKMPTYVREGRILQLAKDNWLAKAGLSTIETIKNGSQKLKNGKIEYSDLVFVRDAAGKVVARGIENVKQLIKAIRDYGVKLK